MNATRMMAGMMYAAATEGGLRVDYVPHNSIWSRVSNNLKRTQPHLSDNERGALCSQIVAGLRGAPAKKRRR